MINTEQVFSFFPPYLRENPAHRKYLIKEYILLLILDFLSTSKYIQKIAFIGGTNLRLVKGIDRFSEDLDFDCKNLSLTDFNKMTDSVLLFLQKFGINAVIKDKNQANLTAYRRNIYFPEFLFDLNLSGHREERFLIKIEAEDQNYLYKPKLALVQSCGFFFSIPVPPDEILCAMKISALLNRSKGRDFYDAIFLLGKTVPDFGFLQQKLGIKNMSELKKTLEEHLTKVDLNHKVKDFEHLVFEKRNSKKILSFPEMVKLLD
ncbi:MAG: nucleotidyl transferase AbiEii/AbiGii toxin family protein [Tenuifilaceae bacterium]|nr:nucleotidyl transferase AbiEii/AbiGii toxin family protein [Tenuifilaceae bacterium]